MDKEILRIGMYVRCPIDEDLILDYKYDESRDYYMGRVTNINGYKVEVEFCDPFGLRELFPRLKDSEIYSFEDIRRVKPLINTKVIYRGNQLIIRGYGNLKESESVFLSYYCEDTFSENSELLLLTEDLLLIPFSRADINPVYQMLNYEVQNPKWYQQRKVVSQFTTTLENAPFGFSHLLGTRVFLLEHQADTIIRALTDKPCRLMLADEVGLGKTIEALSIVKGHLDKNSNLRVLIIVPKALLYQWRNEMEYKFWLNAEIYDEIKEVKSNILLISNDEYLGATEEVISADWDICIVDETHRLLRYEELYKKVQKATNKIKNILLLSATPILHRGREYHKLLSLLNPKRFSDMSLTEFDVLLKKQKYIRDLVFDMMRDLDDYVEFNLSGDFIEQLEDINEYINDSKLTKIIASISSSEEDYGIKEAKIALAYISEFYQIERGIIRHRRAEIPAADIKRECEEYYYIMQGSQYNVYEEETYSIIIECVKDLYAEPSTKDLDIGKRLLSAAMSSPYAVEEVIDELGINNEEIIENNKKWLNYCEREFSRIDVLSDEIETFYAKFSHLIDFIDQEDVNKEMKFIVFTGYSSNIRIFENVLKRFFSDCEVTSFYRGMTAEGLQLSADEFQNNKKCRILICDETGGEGRNFQVADYILHYDLPWSPAILEQRIGRLDRIGRDLSKSVKSVVFISENTIENNLYNLYNEGLSIFTESLCGLEIGFEDFQNLIDKALLEDVEFGLSNRVEDIKDIIEDMKEEVERERYYDLARQLDSDIQERIQRLIQRFTCDDGQELMKTMLSWNKMAGLQTANISDVFKDGGKIISIGTAPHQLNMKSMGNCLYYPNRMDDVIQRAKYRNDIRGTFSRVDAVNHENIAFFAPYNPFFDGLIENAHESYKGRSTAFRYEKTGLEWYGFLLKWNINFNPKKIFENEHPIEAVSTISGYLPLDQIDTFSTIFKKHAGVKFDDINDVLEKNKYEKAVHLGKRDDGAILKYKKRYKNNDYKSIVKASYNNGRNQVKEELFSFIDIYNAKKDLNDLLLANEARSKYYGNIDNNSLISSNEIVESLIWGLEHPIIELDSIAYVELTK